MIEDGYWVLKQYPCSHATAEGLSIGQPFCHSQTARAANVKPTINVTIEMTLVHCADYSLRGSTIIQQQGQRQPCSYNYV